MIQTSRVISARQAARRAKSAGARPDSARSHRPVSARSSSGGGRPTSAHATDLESPRSDDAFPVTRPQSRGPESFRPNSARAIRAARRQRHLDSVDRKLAVGDVMEHNDTHQGCCTRLPLGSLCTLVLGSILGVIGVIIIGVFGLHFGEDTMSTSLAGVLVLACGLALFAVGVVSAICCKKKKARSAPPRGQASEGGFTDITTVSTVTEDANANMRKWTSEYERNSTTIL